MPQIQPVESRHNQKRLSVKLVAGLVGVGIISGLIYGGWYYLGPPSATTTANLVDQLDAAGNYSLAEAKLEEALPRAWKGSDKAIIVSRLAATNVDMGKDPTALTYFQQLNTLEPHQYATLISLGQIADTLGNKPVAIDAYTQALAIRKTQLSHIYAQSEVDQLTSRLEELKQ